MSHLAILLELLAERADRVSRLQGRLIDGRVSGHLTNSARELLYAARTVIDDVIVTLDEERADGERGKERSATVRTAGEAATRPRTRSVKITED